jgi:hypothetical protein
MARPILKPGRLVVKEPFAPVVGYFPVAKNG